MWDSITSPAPICASRLAAGSAPNTAWGANGNFGQGVGRTPTSTTATTNNSDFRARGYITADARNQTEYGTVRGYIAVGLSRTSTAATSTASHHVQREPRLHPVGGLHVRPCAVVLRLLLAGRRWDTWAFTPNSDTGDGGWEVVGYTAQFGQRLLGHASPPKIGARRRSSGRASRLVILPPLSMVWAFQV